MSDAKGNHDVWEQRSMDARACEACIHLRSQRSHTWRWDRGCGHPDHPQLGADVARRPGKPCGPDGALFEGGPRSLQPWEQGSGDEKACGRCRHASGWPDFVLKRTCAEGSVQVWSAQARGRGGACGPEGRKFERGAVMTPVQAKSRKGAKR